MHYNQIYLTGMMGSGKSTIGKILAQKIRFSFIDLDSLIEKQAQKSIVQIFEQHGEKIFRKWETQALQGISNCNYTVIATGGGCILERKNRVIMQNSGLRFFLNADISTLFSRLNNDQSRPLLFQQSLKEKLSILLSQRFSYYQQCEKVFDATLTPTQIVKNIESHLMNYIFG